jgi:LemA protein
MKKKLSGLAITGIVLGVIVLLLVLTVWGNYNSLVNLDEAVSEKWANVQTAYQRRADLIPNLVETVKAYSNYEGEVLTEITNARSRIAGAGSPSELAAGNSDLNSALSRLLVVVEAYPNLKANENYLSLQDELAGTENRIKTERDIYNAAVRGYNTKVRRFPSNVIAGMFGFDQRESFAADAGADVVPKVSFS